MATKSTHLWTVFLKVYDLGIMILGFSLSNVHFNESLDCVNYKF